MITLPALTQKKIRADAKFFFQGTEKFWLKGVTYGTFKPNEDGDYPSPERVSEDFAKMRAAGINTVRIYTVPPRYLLDEALRHGLQVIVGLAWSQHICFLDDRQISEQIRTQLKREVRSCADHPAVLAFAIGNEIPAQIVRWHGAKKIEQFLQQLYRDVKSEAPQALVTYVNYPPTDYLDLSFLDFVCFNVFLHNPSDFKSYLAKLQHIAGHRPLVLTELGIDSIRESEAEQAQFLDWQLRDAFVGGAAGVCVFSWTDDWYRGGNQIEDWAFGLVDAQRHPKPAYQAVLTRLEQIPFAPEIQNFWPKISVVICAYNAASTLEDCLSSLQTLHYPNYEVIIINDGSTDATPNIAARYPYKIISVPNGGLSAARNLGLHAATGEIVAYTDADTRVDEDWLSYLVQPFLTTDVVGVGGPNVVPTDDNWIAQSVARSPGGPTHVMLNDTMAEHIPGCNMAFRKTALEAIGGFDPTYIKAGDDVDICWRLQANEGHLAFSPSALVWHHHRNSVKAYWRQQVGYGEGESFLELRHQEKFNSRGQTRWQGRIYSHLPAYRSLFRAVIYHGQWGAEAFPSIYQGGLNRWHCLPQMIEWRVFTAILLLCGFFESWLLLPALFGLSATIWQCVAQSLATNIEGLPRIKQENSDVGLSRIECLKYRVLIAWLHFIQPLARLRGRIKGLFQQDQLSEGDQELLKTAPPLSLKDSFRLLFSSFSATYWDTRYTDLTQYLQTFRAHCHSFAQVDDGWQQDFDLRVQAGYFCAINIKVTAEDHGGLNRLFRVGFELQRPWLLFGATSLLTGYLGYFLHGHFKHWLPPVIFMSCLAALLIFRVISKGGGKVLALADLVSAQKHLTACDRTAVIIHQSEPAPILEKIS